MRQSLWQSRQSMPGNIEFHHRHHQHHHQHMFNNEFLRQQSEENPILMDIKEILFIMKITGLFPIFKRVSYYEIALPSGLYEYYSYFARGVVYSLTIIYVYLILVSNSMQWFYSKNDIDIRNKWVEVGLVIIAFSVTVFVCGLNFEKYLNIINNIMKIDKEIQEKFHIIPQNNCGFSIKYLIGIGIWQAYVIIGTIFNYSDQNNLNVHFLVGCFSLQNGVIIMFTVFLSTLLNIIGIRFKIFNLILERYTYKYQNSIISRPINIFDARTSMETFKENAIFIFRMHSKLWRIYRSINECVCLIVLIYMGYTFYTFTENTYYLFVETTTQHHLSVKIMVWGITWLILHLALLRLLCRSCGLATQEANAITMILARVYDKNKDHRNIIDKFLIKNIKQKIQFTTYGFFTIDISTLFKIFSAMTTYLVILFQFKQLEESKMEERSTEAAQV